MGYKIWKPTDAQQELMRKLIMDGLNEEEIGKIFNITPKRLAFSKERSRPLRKLLDEGEMEIRAKNVANLQKLADGFKEEVVTKDASGKVIKTEEKYYPPDRNAAVKILEASNPDRWGDQKTQRIEIIKVTLSGEEAKALAGKTKKKIQADYTVEK